MRRVTVVLPAYNESGRIGAVVTDFNNLLLSGNYQTQFVVVDDGSSDGTVEVLHELRKTVPIHIIEHPINRGLGVAIGTGLHYAILSAGPEDIIVTAESDGTQKCEMILRLVESVEKGADLAIASPLWEEGFIGVPWYREYLSRGGNLVYRSLFPMEGLNDYTNLYRGYRAGLLRQGLNTYGTDRFFDRSGFEAVPDLLIKLRRFSPKVTEIPIQIDFTSKSTGSTMGLAKTITGSLFLCAKHLLS